MVTNVYKSSIAFLIVKINSSHGYEEILETNANHLLPLIQTRGYVAIASVDGPVLEFFSLRAFQQVTSRLFSTRRDYFNVRGIVYPRRHPCGTIHLDKNERPLGKVSLTPNYDCVLYGNVHTSGVLTYTFEENMRRELTFKQHRALYVSQDDCLRLAITNQLRWSFEQIEKYVQKLRRHDTYDWDPKELSDEINLERLTKSIVLARSLSKHSASIVEEMPFIEG